MKKTYCIVDKKKKLLALSQVVTRKIKMKEFNSFVHVQFAEIKKLDM